jgi:hypothetical protein
MFIRKSGRLILGALFVGRIRQYGQDYGRDYLPDVITNSSINFLRSAKVNACVCLFVIVKIQEVLQFVFSDLQLYLDTETLLRPGFKGYERKHYSKDRCT